MIFPPFLLLLLTYLFFAHCFLFLIADENHSEEAGSGSEVEELWPENIWLPSPLQRW